MTLSARPGAQHTLDDIANSPNAPTNPPGGPLAVTAITLGGGSSGDGGVELSYVPRLTTAGNVFMSDIAFRGDGQLMGYENVAPGQTNAEGRLTLVNTGTGSSTSVGLDNIPDPANPATFQQIDNDLAFDQAAMAWGGSPITGIGGMTLWYAVPEFGSGLSRLYCADPTNGSAAVVTGQPWGRKGFLNPNPNQGPQNQALITTATPGFGSTNFNLPGSPVTVNFITRTVGTGVTATIDLQPNASIQAGQNPTTTLSFNGATPIITVQVGTTSREASIQEFFVGNTLPMTFTANKAFRPGTMGNNVILQFSKDSQAVGALVPNPLGGGQVHTNLPIISVTPSPVTTTQSQPDIIRVTLHPRLDFTRSGGALNQHPEASKLLSASGGDQNKDISGTQLTQLQLGIARPGQGSTPIPGIDATTAAQVVAAINLVQNPPSGPTPPGPGQLVIASIASGNPNTPVYTDHSASDPTQPNLPLQIDLQPGGGATGFTTGLSFGNDGLLYGVTNTGQFFQNIDLTTAEPSAVPIQYARSGAARIVHYEPEFPRPDGRARRTSRTVATPICCSPSRTTAS